MVTSSPSSAQSSTVYGKVQERHPSHRRSRPLRPSDNMREAEVYISVDVEADGPIPGEYSMLSLGAVRVGPSISDADTFYIELRPVTQRFAAAALEISGLDRDRLLRTGADPADAMRSLVDWAISFAGRPVFVSFS